MSKENFAERLKKIRSKRRYTQEELAKSTQISIQTIRNYEQGRNEPISLHLLCLAQALDVTPEFLLLGDNDMKNYTNSIQKELMQLDDYDKISEIKNEELNSVILSHLEMSEELISAIVNDWNSKNIFKRAKENNDGSVVMEDSYCTRNYVQEVLLRYCQNRSKYKEKFNIKDGIINNCEQL